MQLKKKLIEGIGLRQVKEANSSVYTGITQGRSLSPLSFNMYLAELLYYITLLSPLQIISNQCIGEHISSWLKKKVRKTFSIVLVLKIFEGGKHQKTTNDSGLLNR